MPHSGPQRVYMEQRHDSISTSFGGLEVLLYGKGSMCL